MKFRICFSFMLLLSCISFSQEKLETIITNNCSSYWDTEIGYSWFFDKNGIAIWYENINGERYVPDFGDIIVDFCYWLIDNDTIFFCVDSIRERPYREYEKYEILSINDNYMKVVQRGDYFKKAIVREYKRSDNQELKPQNRYKSETYTLKNGELIRVYSKLDSLETTPCK